MKRIFIIFLISFTITVYAEEKTSEYYYANSNGTILEEFIENNRKIIIRKHENRFRIYPYSKIKAYDRPYMESNELFQLSDGDYVTTTEVAYVVNIINNAESFWVKIISDTNQIGWLYTGIEGDIYSNGNGAVLEIIKTKNKEWHMIKTNIAGLYIFHNHAVSIFDKPGIDNNVLFQLFRNPHSYNDNSNYVIVLGITKETDTIDGKTDYWVNIKDSTGRVGWMFGGYGDRNGYGGPKFNTPENRIEFMFNLP